MSQAARDVLRNLDKQSTQQVISLCNFAVAARKGGVD
jgi:hypothetical protein